jgi:hypothetical protein
MVNKNIVKRKGHIRKEHTRNGKWIKQTKVRPTSYEIKNPLNNIRTKKKNSNPRVFFSFDWTNNWRANQIKNQSCLKTNKKARFVNKSLMEKNKATNEEYIKKKIREGIDKAGTVAIINSSTYDGRTFTNYELEYAIKKNKNMIVINTHNMKDKKGQLGDYTPKPELCREYKIPSQTYTPGKSNLKKIISDAKKPSKRKPR